MPQPTGAALEEIRAHREQLRSTYLTATDQRPATTARGVHHAAFICRDVEQTICFYQDFLGFPLVELVENRDYAGSTHFFFDIGNRNLLGFFDFPGHDHPPFSETIGALQHLAISVSTEAFTAAKVKLDDAGISYLGPDRGADDSLYFRDPNGLGIELYRETLGVFEGTPLLPADA
jgi:glyoxylase I family protein